MTTDPTTLSRGIYSIDGAIAKANGYPYDSAAMHAVIRVFGDINGSNGYKTIEFIDRNGNMYLKVQNWSTWTSWKSVTLTSV